MTETQTEIRDRWLAKKPLYEPHGNCAGCLPNGEPIDEKPELLDDGTHYEGLCNNCVDTAMELDRTYASKLMGFTTPDELNNECGRCGVAIREPAYCVTCEVVMDRAMDDYYYEVNHQEDDS